jgi:Ca2+-binding EF-hand superfamily protein
MALPFLPGYSFSKTVGQNKFHKSHHFDYNNEVALMVGASKPGIGGEQLPFQEPRPNNSNIPRGSGPDLPAWVAFDKQVLSFDSYYMESVSQRPNEPYRVHRCKVLFYLEDDSIQVIEPREKNTGLPQGTIVRRHRIKRPAPYDAQFYTVEDFNIGNELTMYGRQFKLVDCDEFTRNFMTKLGVRLNPPQPLPDDPYSENRKMLEESMQPLRPYEKRDTLKQFLDHDRHVLRFYCVWDDRESNSFGDLRQMVLHYYLADDTVEVREVFPANSGRDAVPTFLRRGRLPKAVEPLRRPGEIADRTVLNVFGPMGRGGRFILDSLKMGAVNQEFYKDSDLKIGATINVYGRKFLICDCDDFTKEYYNAKYGITDFTPIRGDIAAVQPGATASKTQRIIPPYNGFGGEEDSLNSCLSLLPKPPKRDFMRFMEFDRTGLDGHVLRFLARIDTNRPIESDRRFIVSFYLSDGTVSVFEPQGRNTGIPGGKFLERGTVKKPTSAGGSSHYTSSDFFVGATVEFNKHRFILTEADEYAYNYMECHAEEFPQSNIAIVMEKVKQLVADVRLNELASYGALPFEDFRQMMQNICQDRLSDQEIITLARYYQDRGPDEAAGLDTMIALVQEQLKRAGYEDFTSIEHQCMHFDLNRSGFLDQERLRTIFLSMKVPVQIDLVRSLLAALAINEAGQVDYRVLINSINWRRCKVDPPSQLSASRTGNSGNWQGNENQPAAFLVQVIRVDALMHDLGA